MEFTHVPVLLNECIDGLNIRPDGVYVDGTLGRAGHSREIAARLTTGRLICIDRDQAAIGAAKERLRLGETIDDVAKCCGYTSAADFRRVFKRYVGTSPLKWLKSQWR